jgi:competence protein ComEA
MDPSIRVPQPAPGWRHRLPDWLSSPGRAAAAVGGAVVVLAVAVLVLQPAAGPDPHLTLPRAEAAAGSPTPSSPSAPGTDRGTGTGPGGSALVTVHVAGAVAAPGVYALPAGARQADALVAAAGPLAEADLDRLNLAAPLSDGERVWVPRRGEAAPPMPAAAPGAGSGPAGRSAPGPVDVNTATIEQLDTLPGIGPATAEAIVNHRQRNGRFRTVTDLLHVPGIGPAKLEALRPLVRV